jgi:uncharacterized membrane protein (DUF485 family)
MPKKYFYIFMHIFFLILFFKAILLVSPYFNGSPRANIIWAITYPFLFGLYLSSSDLLLFWKHKKEKFIMDVPHLILAIFSLSVVLISVLNFFVEFPGILAFMARFIVRNIGSNFIYFSLLLGFSLPKIFSPGVKNH